MDCYSPSVSQPFKIASRIRLSSFNPEYHEGLDKDKTRAKTEKLCERIGELQRLLYGNRTHSVVLIFQGMDASGKDAAARRVLEQVTPSGVETSNFKAPSAEELAHDYFWRVHKALPRYGNIGVFNRSHYEDVLAVRVLKLKPRDVWAARFAQINVFEKLITQNSVVLLKFFLHIGKDEQAERLRARSRDPTKRWKFDAADLKSRKLWSAYQLAYADVLNRCSTDYAPWHVVPANHKWYRDYVIARTVVRALEKLKMKWPKEDLSRIGIK